MLPASVIHSRDRRDGVWWVGWGIQVRCCKRQSHPPPTAPTSPRTIHTHHSASNAIHRPSASSSPHTPPGSHPAFNHTSLTHPPPNRPPEHEAGELSVPVGPLVAAALHARHRPRRDPLRSAAAGASEQLLRRQGAAGGASCRVGCCAAVTPAARAQHCPHPHPHPHPTCTAHRRAAPTPLFRASTPAITDGCRSGTGPDASLAIAPGCST